MMKSNFRKRRGAISFGKFTDWTAVVTAVCLMICGAVFALTGCDAELSAAEERQAEQNQQDGAYKHQHNLKQRPPAFRVKNQVDPEQGHAQQSADYRAEKTVAAMELGHLQIAAHAEDRADAGEGRRAVKKVIYKCAQSGCNGRFDVAHANFRELPGLTVVTHSGEPLYPTI